MTVYLGDFYAGATVHFMFNTNGSSGQSITRSTDGTISCYKNNGTTQDTDGITTTEDFDGLTGVHAVTIDLSADATFYSEGANFSVVLSGATIDTQTVNAVLAHFSIKNRFRGIDWAEIDNAGEAAELSGTFIGGADDCNVERAQNQDIDNFFQDQITAAEPINANLTQILGSNITGTAAQIVAAFTKWFNVATPTGTVNSIPDAVAGASGGLMIAGSNAATTVNITGNLTGNVSGSVGSVTGAVGSVTGNVGGNVTGSVGSLAAQAKTDVNAEVLDVLNVDTFAQPGQGAPAATTTLSMMIRYLYKAWRNLNTQTATTYSLYADDGTTVDHKATVSDDNTTFSRSEIVSGP